MSQQRTCYTCQAPFKQDEMRTKSKNWPSCCRYRSENPAQASGFATCAPSLPSPLLGLLQALVLAPLPLAHPINAGIPALHPAPSPLLPLPLTLPPE